MSTARQGESSAVRRWCGGLGDRPRPSDRANMVTFEVRSERAARHWEPLSQYERALPGAGATAPAVGPPVSDSPKDPV
ncbi:hypothetical protein GCM10009579_46180 [Streptomyces javensis]|uniref:Uncharacterized protein n=1 Tax=Streptomyces javensis TaxID=114698 RepID=A0ABN1X5M5_9ACTN